MNPSELNKIAVAMVTPGKDILAADESSGTIKKRFDAIKVDEGRALQAAPQKAWSGKTESVAAGQRALAHRAQMNGLASKGAWESGLEKKVA